MSGKGVEMAVELRRAERHAGAVKPVLAALLQAGARLYRQFTIEVLETFGRAGEMTVREHLRAYGAWRGTEMREAHNALGRRIDMETLMRGWDSASTYVVKDELEDGGHYSPGDVSFDVTYCPAAEVWKAEDFHRWGHVYCDEVHQAVAGAYHPDGTVVIPINMMKGDGCCRFRWVLPQDSARVAPYPAGELGARLADTYRATSEADGARLAMVRTSRLLAARYLTFARAIRSRHEEGEAQHCVERALRRWAHERGALLARRHEQDGVEPVPANLVRQSDLAAKWCWELSETDVGDDRYRAEVAHNPLDETWRDYDAGADARTFWEQSVPAFALGYGHGLRAVAEIADGAGSSLSALTFERVA